MRIVITGSNGNLGQKLVDFCIKKGYTFIATSKGENRNPNCPDYLYLSMDICNKLEINRVFDTLYPTLIIHTAALTNVDFCESNPLLCQQVNVDSTALLFHAAQQFEAHFKFISPILDGIPQNVYESSKLEGIQKLKSSEYKHWSVLNFSENMNFETFFEHNN